MQIRCYHCHKPYAIGKDAVIAALEQMKAEELSHYNVPCPHCGRVNRVSQNELMRAAPDWERASQERKSNDTDT